MAISALIKDKMDVFRHQLDAFPFFQKMEQTTHVPKEYAVLGVALIVAICFISGRGAAFICNLAGFVYPAYMSFQAIEAGHKKDGTQWLTYWLVYSALSIPETFASLLSWIPFYYIFKLLFLVWCFHPSTMGASTIYDKCLKDALVKSEATIDKLTGGAAKQD